MNNSQTSSPAKEHETWFSSDLLNSTVRYGLVLIGALGAVLSMAGDFTESNAFLKAWLFEHVNMVNVVLHLVLITLILFPARIRPLSTDLTNPNVRMMAECINAYFLNSWKFIWAGFGLLYVIMLFIYLEPHHFSAINFGPWMYSHKLLELVLADLANVGSTAAIIFCGIYLSPRFFRKYVAIHTDKDQQKDERLKTWKMFHQNKLATWISLLIGFAIIVVVFRVFALQWMPCLKYTEACIDLALGILSAMALGLLAGRLDSPFIANWQWVIVMLYLYGSMQVFSNSLMDDSEATKAAFLYSAFSLKCIWFIFVSDHFANKRILYYAYESVRPMNEREL